MRKPLARGVGTEAAHVEVPHVLGRLALHHPLRRVAARAAAEHDAEDAEAGEHEEVRQLRHPAHQAAAVGRVAVGPVDDRLEAGGLERRDALAGGHEHVLDLVEAPGEEATVEVVGHSVHRPRARVHLERPDQERVALLARVEGGLGVAQHGQLGVAGAHLLDLLGDDVVVLERHDREVGARQPRHLPGPLARRVHHDVGPHLPAQGLHEPAVAVAGKPADRRVAHDPRAARQRCPEPSRS